MKARVVRRTEGRDAHLFDAQRRGLPGEHGANVDVRLTADRWLTQRLSDFRTYFIARTANRYATMHYNIGDIGASALDEQGHSGLENPRRGAAPTGVQQCDGPARGIGQVH